MRSTTSVLRPKLVAVLLGAYRWQVLALLLLHPDKTFHVHEIAKLLTSVQHTQYDAHIANTMCLYPEAMM